MTPKKFTIGTQFEVFCTTHERHAGTVDQDVFVVATKTQAIVGQFCSKSLPAKAAAEGRENVLNYYWLEAALTEPGCSVKDVTPAI